MTPAVEIQGLWAGYDGNVALEDVNLTVPRGDYLALVGPNGGGKTTLLKVVLGLLKPLRGEVRVLGQTPEAGRVGVGYVPQLIEFDRDFPVRVEEVVRMGRLGTTDRKGDAEAIRKALALVEMDPLARRPMGDLSGGQRQRVYLARALAADPQMLLLDEPTAHLDPEISARIYELLLKLTERMTVILTTHDIGVVASYAKTLGCVGRRLYLGEAGGLTQSLLEKAYGVPVRVIGHHHPKLEPHDA